MSKSSKSSLKKLREKYVGNWFYVVSFGLDIEIPDFSISPYISNKSYEVIKLAKNKKDKFIATLEYVAIEDREIVMFDVDIRFLFDSIPLAKTYVDDLESIQAPKVKILPYKIA